MSTVEGGNQGVDVKKGGGKFEKMKKKGHSKKDKPAKPKMTKAERRAKFLRPKVLPGKRRKEFCFGCREKGHRLKDCPNKTGQGTLCFNCGSTEHTLKDCMKPRDGDALPYASCFVCGGKGHLSSQCPQNEHGLYPKGGGCHRCRGVDHLSSDCPKRKEVREKQRAKEQSKRPAPDAEEDQKSENTSKKLRVATVSVAPPSSNGATPSAARPATATAPSSKEPKANGTPSLGVAAKKINHPIVGGDDLEDDFELSSGGDYGSDDEDGGRKRHRGDSKKKSMGGGKYKRPFGARMKGKKGGRR